MIKYILLGSLFLPLSAFASNKPVFEENDLNISLSPPSKNKVSDFENAFREVSLDTMLEAWKNRTLLTVGKKEYIVLQEDPKLKSSSNDSKYVRANPCYVGGLGPYLLKEKDLENLPMAQDGVHWFMYKCDMNKYMNHTFITVRYTTEDNPHWQSIARHPEPFKDPNTHYWHTEHLVDTTMPLRTVNFILQKVKNSF